MTPDLSPSPQLTLFRELGVDAAPVGVSELTRKQQTFVLAYLRTGIASAAAREAGYSDPEADACKLRKQPVIQAVIAQASRAAGANAEALVAGMWRRKQAYLAEWEELYPRLREKRVSPVPLNEDFRKVREAELAELEARERVINAELGKIESTLKGIDVKVEGEVDHHVRGNVVVLNEELAKQLVEMRRETLQHAG
jgi:phage terminase small subunit